jgi:4-hydroxy-3-polyprenylbenzoate decarboxylase
MFEQGGKNMTTSITDTREAIKYFEEKGELLVVDKEINPVHELAGFVAAMDGGPVLLFNNIKGYLGHRVISNIFATRKRMADFVGAPRVEYTAKAIAEAAHNPISPKIVSSAPCQENVIDRDIDLVKMLPIPIQTPRDAGHIITGGQMLIKMPDSDAFNISFHRLAVRGKDYCSIGLSEARHLTEVIASARRKGMNVPVTANIQAIPVVILTAGSETSTLMPFGYDELGFAGALQGSPVEVVPTKTVEGGWSLAKSEWVLEGYINTQVRIHEEAHEEPGKHYFMAEYPGTMGQGWRTLKFQVTGITYRNNPIYFFPIASSLASVNLLAPGTEGAAYDICKKVNPAVFDTCFVLPFMKGCFGLVLRVNKRTPRDEGVQTQLMHAALGTSGELRWIIAVDRDINIADANDVMWAVVTRVNPKEDISIGTRGGGIEEEHLHGAESGLVYKVCIDATLPLQLAFWFERARFQKVNLENWVSKERLAEIQARQALEPHAATLSKMLADKDWSIRQPYPG